MSIQSKYIAPKFQKKTNPKVGLLALSTDLTIENDFNTICHKLPFDLFINRIHNENPLTKENLLKMHNQIESVTEKILPGQKINTIAYGCTSGTIAIGEEKVKEKVQLAKPGCYVTTPITSALKAFKEMNLKKMADDIPKVTEDILPDQKLDCVAYGCTSGTIAAGYQSIYEKVNLAKPNTKVTTPITSAINALKNLNIKKLSIFTPYTNEINQSVINYFKNENIEIDELTYFDIASDLDIGKVDPQHLFDTLVKIDLSKSDALFVSCTALPVLSIISELEKKINKVVLSSNQTLIWDTLKEINFKNKIEGFGQLFNS